MLFSIIVPVYNVEKYIKQCVDSLIDQQYDIDDYEIILVDDGSPDNCPQICDEYKSICKNIKVIHKKNGGLSDARNAGIKAAEGQYITFVDSDDFWKNKCVLSDINEIIHNENFPDVIVSDIIKYYDKENSYEYPVYISEDSFNGLSKIETINYLYFKQGDLKISACQKFIKHDIIIDCLFTKGLLSEDIDWSLNIYTRISSISVYSKPYYCYRQEREGSITNTASQRSFDSLTYIIDKWSNKLLSINITDQERDIYFGYLGYQLSIAILLLNRTEKSRRKDNIRLLKGHLNLYKYPLNFKTYKVAKLINIFGIKLTALALEYYIKLRKFNNS